MDIDIDVKSSLKKEEYGTRAMIYNADQETVVPHPSGVYLSPKVPIDQETGLSAIPYDEIEKYGVLKVDLLSNTSYDGFESKQAVLEALHAEIDWGMFQDRTIVEKLPQIASHYDLVAQIKPSSIEDLADILALIRPGKSKLIQSYLSNKEVTRDNLYRKPKSGIYFKKSHAIAYACMIVSVLNRIGRKE